MKKNSLIELPVSEVYPNPDQPRKDFEEEKLEELAMSIKEHGVLEPIVVTRRDRGFMIVAGERRFRASLLVRLESIPARVIEASDDLVEELALIENIQRENLNIIEEGQAYKRLLDRGLTLKQLAKKLGYKKTGPIEDRVSLLNLTPMYQELVIKGDINPSQAYELSKLPEDKQDVVYAKIKKGELNTFNKLFAFVQAMITIENQEEIFALTPLTEKESNSINTFNGLMTSVERFIGKLQEEDNLKHLEKAVIHTDITAARFDLIIKSLQKIRRIILVGDGAKKASKVAA
jgi:ParB family chromosome partitioning protein